MFKFLLSVNEPKSAGTERDRYCKQILLGRSFGSGTSAVTLMSIFRELHCIRMMGKQLKEYFVTGLLPKGINNDFLLGAASLLGWGRGGAASCKQSIMSGQSG